MRLKVPENFPQGKRSHAEKESSNLKPAGQSEMKLTPKRKKERDEVWIAQISSNRGRPHQVNRRGPKNVKRIGSPEIGRGAKRNSDRFAGAPKL